MPFPCRKCENIARRRREIFEIKGLLLGFCCLKTATWLASMSVSGTHAKPKWCRAAGALKKSFRIFITISYWNIAKLIFCKTKITPRRRRDFFKRFHLFFCVFSIGKSHSEVLDWDCFRIRLAALKWCDLGACGAHSASMPLQKRAFGASQNPLQPSEAPSAP